MEQIFAVLNRIGDIVWNIFNTISTIGNFIINLISFIINGIGTIIKYIGRAFTTIFGDGLFNPINQGLSILEQFIGTMRTNVLIVLVVLVFALIVFGFVMRLLKGTLHYQDGIKRYEKNLKK